MRLLREKYNIDETAMGVVSQEDIQEVVARWTGVPVTSIKEEEMSKLLRIEEELHRRIISQDKAISALSRAIRRSRAGLKAPGRPVGSFLFLGPTGVGKTEVARSLGGATVPESGLTDGVVTDGHLLFNNGSRVSAHERKAGA